MESSHNDKTVHVNFSTFQLTFWRITESLKHVDQLLSTVSSPWREFGHVNKNGRVYDILEVQQLGSWHVFAFHFRTENQERLLLWRGQNDKFKMNSTLLRQVCEVRAREFLRPCFMRRRRRFETSRRGFGRVEVDVDVYHFFWKTWTHINKQWSSMKLDAILQYMVFLVWTEDVV